MTEQDWLLETLEELEDDELKRFKISLEKIPPKGRRGRHISLDRLISADSIDLSDLLIAHYGKRYGKKVTVRVLRDIRRPRAAGACKARENEEEKSQWEEPAGAEPHGTSRRGPQSPEEGGANLSQSRGIQQWGDPQGQRCGELTPYINHSRKITIRERILHLHIQKEERPCKCPDCGKGFSQKSNLIRHQRIHTGEKPYKCGKCGKSFNDSSNRNRHEKLHLGLTPYHSPEYGKRFGLNSDLVCHQRIHTGEKPFKCFECGKRFTTKSSLGIHHRIHTGEKPFKCFKCGKRFTTKSSLGIHHRIHTGEKPFKCFKCEKRFTTKGSLGIHHRIHTGEKPYQCFDCKKRFSVTANLIRHQRIHTGEKPYKCSKCEKSFNDHSNLTKHKRIHEAGVRSRSEDATSGSWGKDKCDLCRREKDFAEVVHPEILPGPEENQKTYRVHFLQAGSFRCSATDLGFEVRAAVTVSYKYESWRGCQTDLEKQEWTIAGPLFNIWAEPAGAVAAVHFPHFMCLAGGEADVSRMRIAHFIDGRMTPEEPTRVMPFHVVLENPSFSLWGPILKAKYMLFSSIHSVALLYRAFKAQKITFHLYLIPDIRALKKVIDDNERTRRSIRVHKSSKTKQLTQGSHYMVCSPSDIEVMPEELEFCYVDLEDEHPFMEIYTKDLADRLELSLVKQSDRQLVWKAVVRPEIYDGQYQDTPTSEVEHPQGDTSRKTSVTAQSDIEHGSPSTEGHRGGGRGKTVKDHLLDTLKELHKQELKEFKSKLTDIKLKEGYRHVPRCDLENAGPLEVTSLLINHYRERYAVKVTTMVLEAINQNQLAETLLRATRAGRE